MVAGFVTAIQSAVMAIETEFGPAAARNYVQKNGAVTITGAKTFQDGAAFGTGNIAGTGLVVAAGVVGQQHRDQQDGGAREHRDHGGYTLVGLKRQDELTRRIQDKRAKAAKKAKKVVEMKKKEDAA